MLCRCTSLSLTSYLSRRVLVGYYAVPSHGALLALRYVSRRVLVVVALVVLLPLRYLSRRVVACTNVILTHHAFLSFGRLFGLVLVHVDAALYAQIIPCAATANQTECSAALPLPR